MLFLLSLIVAQTFSVQPTSIRRIVEAPVKEIFIPTGFDENDIPQFIIEGEFKNGCYELKEAKYVKRETKTADFHKVWFQFWVEAFETDPRDCEKKKQDERNVPYLEVVSISPKLPQGIYEIWHNQNKSNPAGWLSIAEAPKGTRDDTYTYAQVEKPVLEKDELRENQYLLSIEGKFPSNCHEIDLEKTQFIQHTARIIEVLPVIKKFRDDNCVEKPVEFERILPVPKKLLEKRYLFHIRIAKGKAVNLKVDLSDLKHQIIHKDPIDEEVEKKLNPLK